MTLKNGLLGAAVVIALVALAVSVSKSPTIVERTVEKVVDQVYGSASSPSVVDGCMEVNGVTRCYQKMAMRVGTTTPCDLVGPSASSTLVHLTAKFNTASTTLVTLAKSAVSNATTTFLESASITTGTEPVVLTRATTTGAYTASKYYFGPRDHAVMGISGAVVTTTGPTGFCSAEWVLTS